MNWYDAFDKETIEAIKNRYDIGYANDYVSGRYEVEEEQE